VPAGPGIGDTGRRSTGSNAKEAGSKQGHETTES
jgi:hypothetical protein